MERSDTVLTSGIYFHGDIRHCPFLRYLFSLRYRTLSSSQVFIVLERSDTVLSLATFHRLKSKIGVSECTELIIFIFLCRKSTNFIVSSFYEDKVRLTYSVHSIVVCSNEIIGIHFKSMSAFS